MPNPVRPAPLPITVPEPLQNDHKILFDPQTGQLAVRRPTTADRDAIIVDAIAEEGFFATPDPAVESPLRAETVMA